jgi:hypothetical protein
MGLEVCGNLEVTRLYIFLIYVCLSMYMCIYIYIYPNLPQETMEEEFDFTHNQSSSTCLQKLCMTGPFCQYTKLVGSATMFKEHEARWRDPVFYLY